MLHSVFSTSQLKSAPGTVGAVQKGHTRLAPVSVTSLDSPWEGEEEEKVVCMWVHKTERSRDPVPNHTDHGAVCDLFSDECCQQLCLL